MEPDSLSSLIDRLEEEVETLAGAAARSRRLMLLSRAAVAAGVGWLAAGIGGVAPLEATHLVFAIAAVIGGIVVAGSSRSTLQEIETAMRKAEDTRRQLIDRLDPEIVEPRGPEADAPPPGRSAEIIELFPRSGEAPARRTVH